MPDPVLIDLGEVRHAPPAPVPAARRRRPARSRAAGAVAVAALLTMVTAAAPVADPLAVIVLPASAGASVAVDAATAYLMDAPENGGAPTISAYRLADGARRWRVPLPVPAGSADLTVTPDALLAVAFQAGQVVALDLHTGRLRWRHRGIPVGSAGGRVLLSRPDPGEPRRHWLDLVDARGGDRLSSHPVPTSAQIRPVWTRAGLTHLLVGLPGGRVEVREPMTGRVRAAAHIGPRRAVDADAWLLVDGDLVLVVEPLDSRLVTAYGVADLRRRWTASWVLAAGWLPTVTCARTLCLSADAEGVAGIDRATGHLRWQTSRDWVWEDGAAMLAGVAGVGPVALLDPATGAHRRDLGTWEVTTSVAPGSRPLLVRPGRPAALATLVGGAEVRVVGYLSDGVTGCRVMARTVVCWAVDGGLRLVRPRHPGTAWVS